MADRITLNFNNKMSTAAVFLDIEKAFDKIWHSGLLYKWSELAFSTSPIKLVASFLTNRKLKVLVEDEFSTPRNIATGVPQGSVLAPILYNLYCTVNDAPAAPGTHLALFADLACVYATEIHERCVLCKLQRDLTTATLWCERWNINVRKTQAIYFSGRLRVPEGVLQLNGQDIPVVNNSTYLGVTFDRRTTWRIHSERTVVKALRTYLRAYSLFKSERLSTSIKLAIYKALIRLVTIYAYPTWEYAVDPHLLKLQRLQNRVLYAIGNLNRRTPVR
jgi:hypothetical protein